MNNTLENGTASCFPYLSDETLPTAVNSINLILAVPINSYVLRLLLRGAGGTIASEFFYINLTVSVIIFSLLAPVFYFAMVFTRNAVFCTAQKLVSILFFISALSLLCCICVERFVAVVHPVVFLRYKHLRYRGACCCTVWLAALAFTLLYIWSRSALLYIGPGIGTVCISVVSFCCLSVLRALKQPGHQDMKERAFRIILVSLIVMVGTVVIYIAHIILILLLNRDVSSVALQITYTIVMLPGFFYPLLYIHKAGKLPCFKVALNAG